MTQENEQTEVLTENDVQMMIAALYNVGITKEVLQQHPNILESMVHGCLAFAPMARAIKQDTAFNKTDEDLKTLSQMLDSLHVLGYDVNDPEPTTSG